MDSLNKGINSIHRKVNLLTSFSSIFKNPELKIKLPNNRNKLMIDSGAFDLLIRGNLEEFPFSPGEYAKRIKDLEIKPDYVVSMDYICSPEENNNNFELIQKTIKNAEILRKKFERGGDHCFIPVVQGYYLEEYQYCIKEMLKRKIVQNGDYIGLGSLATRKQVGAPREIINAVYKFLKDSNISVNIHCFGLNLNIIKNEEIFNMISSIDSLSWTFPYRFGRVKMFTRERMIEANSNGSLKEPEFYYLSLNSSLKYIDFLNLKYHNYQKEISKDIDLLVDPKQRKNKQVVFRKLAKRLGIIDKTIHENNNLKDLYKLIISQNKKFPREFKRTLDKIPAYTSHKFLLLEPKNIKISKFEFSYLFFAALESAYLDYNLKNKINKNDFISFIRDIIIQLDEKYLKDIREILKFIKTEGMFDNLIQCDDDNKFLKYFYTVIRKIINNIELKLFKIEKFKHKRQSSLSGNLNEDYNYLLIEDFEL